MIFTIPLSHRPNYSFVIVDIRIASCCSNGGEKLKDDCNVFQKEAPHAIIIADFLASSIFIVLTGHWGGGREEGEEEVEWTADDFPLINIIMRKSNIGRWANFFFAAARPTTISPIHPWNAMSFTLLNYLPATSVYSDTGRGWARGRKKIYR